MTVQEKKCYNKCTVEANTNGENKKMSSIIMKQNAARSEYEKAITWDQVCQIALEKQQQAKQRKTEGNK